jgi:large subunit ribosomal protein L13
MIIDGSNCVLGRVATVVAKKALAGEPVTIINAEKIVITGNPVSVVREYRALFEIRNIAKPVRSPHWSKRPDLFVKRSIRGMLPRRTERGTEALARIRAYIGDNGMKGEKVAEHNNPAAKTITVLELCKALGWKG